MHVFRLRVPRRTLIHRVLKTVAPQKEVPTVTRDDHRNPRTLLHRTWGRVLSSLNLATRFAGVAVLPVLALLALAVLSGLVRTTALVVFGLVAGVRGAMVAVDRAAATTPAPRLPAGVVA